MAQCYLLPYPYGTPICKDHIGFWTGKQQHCARNERRQNGSRQKPNRTQRQRSSPGLEHWTGHSLTYQGYSQAPRVHICVVTGTSLSHSGLNCITVWTLRCKIIGIILQRFSSFYHRVFFLVWPWVPLLLSEVLIMTKLVILIHLGPTKVFLQHLLALAHPADLGQLGNRNEVLKGGSTTDPRSLHTQPLLSSHTNPLQRPRGFSTWTPMGKPIERAGREQCCSLSLLIVSRLSDLLWLTLSGKVCIIWQ